MIKYKEFEESVKNITTDFEGWKYLLPSVPLAHRGRFVTVLKAGFDMPTAFDYVMTSMTLNEERFLSFLAEAIKKMRQPLLG